MTRGTTPTHTFTLPSNASEYSDIHITYVQNGNIILEKNKSDLTISGTSVSITLTQEETNLFSTTEAKVQLRVRTTGGTVLASNIIHFGVRPVLCDEVLPLS